jgi:bacterioferritin-associated ferredoxin
MYVCICNGITEREIRSCIEDGATSLRDLRKRLCIGTQCGKCVRDVRSILREEGTASDPAFTDMNCAA